MIGFGIGETTPAGGGTAKGAGSGANRSRSGMQTGELSTPSAIVTAGVSGLGRAVAATLLEHGYAVTTTYRTSEERARQFDSLARAEGMRLQTVRADAADPDAVQRSVDAHVEAFGTPWALVHAAGPFLFSRQTLAETRVAEMRAMVDGNLGSAMFYARAVVPGMRAAGGGRIVFFGFDHAAELPAWPDRVAYAAAKSGVVSLTKGLAAEEAKSGITVNAVCPGDIRSELKEASIAEAVASREVAAPIGRPGSGEDVARVIAFLLSPHSDFLTGNVIYVNGGLDVLHDGRR